MKRLWGHRGAAAGPPAAFWKQQGWIFSAVFLVAVLVIAGIGLVTASGDDPAAQARERSGPLSAGGPRTAAGRPPGCSTDDSDTTVPKSAPADIRWRTLGRGRVPVSLSAGPLQTYQTMLWCFARTPLGAALAAQVIYLQLRTPEWRVSAEQQLVDGNSKEFYIGIHPDGSEMDLSEEMPEFAGFAVPRFSPDEASVALLVGRSGGDVGTGSIMSGGSTQYRTTTMRMKWTDGDWKVDPTSASGITDEWNPAESVAAFVTWRG